MGRESHFNQTTPENGSESNGEAKHRWGGVWHLRRRWASKIEASDLARTESSQTGPENQAQPTVKPVRSRAARKADPYSSWRKPLAAVAGLSLLVTGLVGLNTLSTGKAQAADTLEDNGYNKTFFVNDVRDIPDANPGDGKCDVGQTIYIPKEINGKPVIKDGQPVIEQVPGCTIYAAIQEANARPQNESILITVADKIRTVYEPEQSSDTNRDANDLDLSSLKLTNGELRSKGIVWLDWDSEVFSSIQNPENVRAMIPNQQILLQQAGSDRGGTNNSTGARYVLNKSNVTIDLQKRLSFLMEKDSNKEITFLLNGKDQEIRNFNRVSAGTIPFMIGGKAENARLENGEITNTAAKDGSRPAESAVVIVAGAKNTMVKNVDFKSMYLYNIAFVAQAGTRWNVPNPDAQVEKVVLDGLLFEASETGDKPYGIAPYWGAGYPNVTVNNLSVVNSRFRNFGSSFYFGDEAAAVFLDNARFNNAVIAENDFYVDNVDLPSVPNPLSIYLGDALNKDSTVDIYNNSFRWATSKAHSGTKHAPWNSWIFAQMPNGSAGVKIHDNQFDGMAGSAPQLGLGRNQTTWELHRNTFLNVTGPDPYSTDYGSRGAFSGVDTEIQPVGVNWRPFETIKTATTEPFTRVNENISETLQLKPSTLTRNKAGELTVKTEFYSGKNIGGLFSAAKYIPDLADDRWPLCVEAYIGTNREPGANRQYEGREQGNFLQQYLGVTCLQKQQFVDIASRNNAKLDLTFPYTGDLADKSALRRVRLMATDAKGNSTYFSPASETYSGNPELGKQMQLDIWVKRSGWRADNEDATGVQPARTFDRFAEFDIFTSEPVTEESLRNVVHFREEGEDKLSDGKYHGPDKQGMTLKPLSSNLWKLRVARSSAGTITPYIPANVITPADLEGREDAAKNTASNSAPAPGNVLGKEMSQAYQIKDSDVKVTYRPPLQLTTETGEKTLELEEGKPGVKVFKLTNVATRDVAGYPQVIKAPIGDLELTLRNAKTEVTPDSKVNPLAPTQKVEDVLQIVGQGADKSAIDPAMKSYERDFNIYVQARDNQVVDGTRTTTFSLAVNAKDPEFDGLYLDYKDFQVKVKDNDQPVQAGDKTTRVEVVKDNQVANGTAQDSAKLHVINAGIKADSEAIPPIVAQDPQAVSNAKVKLVVPNLEGLKVTVGNHAVDGASTDEAARTISVVTGEDGLVNLTATSTVAGAIQIPYTIETADDTTPDAQALTGNVTLNFLPKPIHETNSHYEVSTGEKVAGNENHTVTVTLVDKDGEAVRGVASQLELTSSDPKVTVQRPQGQATDFAETDTPGQYRALLRASEAASAEITVKAKQLGAAPEGAGSEGEASAQAADVQLKMQNNKMAVFVSGDKLTAENSSFTVGETPVVADGVQTVPLTVKLRSDQDAEWKMAGTVTITVPEGVTLTGEGCVAASETATVYTCTVTAEKDLEAQLTSTRQGDFPIKVEIPGEGEQKVELPASTSNDKQQNTAHFVAGEATQVIFEDGPHGSVTSGTEVKGDQTGKVLITDANGNPVKSQDFWVKVPGQADPIKVTTGPDGKANIPAFTPGLVDDNKIQVFKPNTENNGADTENGKVGEDKTLNVQPGPADANKSSFTLQPETPVTGQNVTMTGQLKDAAGNPIPNQTVTVKMPDGSLLTGTTDESGNLIPASPDQPLQFVAGEPDKAQTVELHLGESADQDAFKMAQVTPQKDPEKVGIPVVDGQKLSTAQITAGNKLANGTEKHTVTVTLKDAYGMPVNDAASALSLTTDTEGFVTSGDSADLNLGSFQAVPDQPGHYLAEVTSTKVGTAQLKVKYAKDGNQVEIANNLAASFIAGQIDAGSSTLTTDKATYRAGEEISFTYTPKDAAGHVLKDFNGPVKVILPGTSEPVVLTKQGDGTFTGKIRAKKAGQDVTVTSQITVPGDSEGGQPQEVAGPTAKVTINPGEPATTAAADAEPGTQVTSFTAPSGAVKVGDQNKQVTVTRLTDAYGNVISDHSKLTANATPSGGTDGPEPGEPQDLPVTAGESGTYTVNVPTAEEKTQTIQFFHDGQPLGDPVVVTVSEQTAGVLDAGASKFNVALTDSDKNVANGTDSYTVTVTLVDREEKPLAGAQPKITVANLNDAQVSAVVADESHPGTYRATITSTKSGVGTVSVKVGEETIAKDPEGNNTVTFVAGPASTVEFESVPGTATSGTPVNADQAGTVTVRDEQGNPVPQLDLWVQVPGQNDLVAVRTDDSGKFQIPGFTPKQAGDQKISVYKDAQRQSELGNATVKVSAGTPSAEQTDVTLTPERPVSAGGADNPVTGTNVKVGGTVKDEAGNLIPNRNLTVKVQTGEGDAQLIPAKTNENGEIVKRDDNQPIIFPAGNVGEKTVVEVFDGDKAEGAVLGKREVTAQPDPGATGIPVFEGKNSSQASIDNDGQKLANNQDARVVTVVLKDTYGQPVTGKADNLKLTKAEGSIDLPQLDSVRFSETASAGTYTAQIRSVKAGDAKVTAGYQATAGEGDVTVIPTAAAENNVLVGSFAAGPVDLGQTTVTVTKGQPGSGSTAGDGEDLSTAKSGDEITITVSAKDAQGNPTGLAGDPETIQVNVPGVDQPVTLTKDPASGNYVGTTTLDKASSDDAKLTFPEGSPLHGKEKSFTVTAGNPKKVTMPDSVTGVAGQENQNPGQFTVTDEAGNPAKGQTVYVKVPGADGFTPVELDQEGKGTIPAFTPGAEGNQQIIVANNQNGEPVLGRTDVQVKTRPKGPSELKANASKVTGQVDPSIPANSVVTVKNAQGEVIGTGQVVTGEDGQPGTFEVTYTEGKVPGDKENITVTVTTDGLTSDPVTVQVDKSVPSEPSIEVDKAHPETVKGEADQDTKVKVCVTPKQGEAYCAEEIQVGPNGKFEVKLPDGKELKDGDSVKVVSTNPQGNSSESSTTVDFEGPQAPAVKVEKQDDGTAKVTVTVADPSDVAGKPQVCYQAEGSDQCEEIADDQVKDNGDGTFTVTIPAQKLGKPGTVKATVKDSNGNVSAEGAAAVPATVTPAVKDPIANGTQVTGEVDKSVVDGSPVKVKDNQGNVIGTGQVKTDADGKKSFVVKYDSGKQPQDKADLQIVVTDSKTGIDSEPVRVTVDAVAPKLSVDASNGTKVTGHVDDPTAEVTVTYTDAKGQEHRVPVNLDNQGNFVVEKLEPAAKDGSVVTVTATDPAGNTGKATVKVDASKPSEPTITLDPKNPGKVSGTGDAGNQIKVCVKKADREEPICIEGTVGPDGKYQIELPEGVKLADGDQVTVTATDPNTGATTSRTEKVDFTAPDAPSEVKISKDGLKVSGKGEPGSTVKVKLPGGKVVTGVVDPDGRFVITLPDDSRLKHGDQISVTLTDQNGNESKPTKLTADLEAGLNEVKLDGDSTVTGKTDPGSTVVVTDKDGKELGNAKTGKDGRFTIKLGKPLKDGQVITVTTTDPAGNRAQVTLTYQEPKPEPTPNKPSEKPSVDPKPVPGKQNLKQALVKTGAVGSSLFWVALVVTTAGGVLIAARRRQQG